MLKIAVLVSGGGTNLQALIDACGSGIIKNGMISAVISSRDGVYALERAKAAGIPTRVIARRDYGTAGDFDTALLDALKDSGAELVVLAGFLSILGKRVIEAYPNRIINVHPSLIPAFCGDGFYGLKVHESALRYGVKVTGATVHFVNEVTDGGAIILQKAVEVQQGDTPEMLQQRVMRQAEWEILPQAVGLFCDGKIRVADGRTILDE